MVLSDISIKDLCTNEGRTGYGTVFYYTDYVSDMVQPTFEETPMGTTVRTEVGHKVERRIRCPKPMVDPFVDHSVKTNDAGERIISYGLSSYGYDVRLARNFKIFTNINAGIVDPLVSDEGHFVDREGDYVIVPPNGYVLGHTLEYFTIPRDVIAICMGKSTYARCSCQINVTPIEPEFEGQVVIEISNASPLPLKVYANQGIAQFLFLLGDKSPMVSYADRSGKYQGQRGIVTAR